MEVSFNKNSGFLVKQKKLQLAFFDQTVKIMNEGLEPVIISGPGEYEVGSVAVNSRAINTAIIYVCELEELKLAYLGELKEKLTDEQSDWLDGIDVLLVSGQPVEVVKQISPSVAVAPAAIAGWDSPVRHEPKLTINKLDLPEETEVVIVNG